MRISPGENPFHKERIGNASLTTHKAQERKRNPAWMMCGRM
jgi:hypothetical protein